MKLRYLFLIFSLYVFPPYVLSAPLATCHNGVSSGTSTNCTITAGANKSLVVGTFTHSDGSAIGISGSSLTYTFIAGQFAHIAGDGASRGFKLFCVLSTGSGGSQTYTMTDTGTVDGIALLVAEYPAFTSCTPDGTPSVPCTFGLGSAGCTVGNPNSTISSGNLVTTASSDTVISMLQIAVAAGLSAGAPFTIQVTDNNWIDATQPFLMADVELATAGTYNSTYTAAGSQYWQSIIVAFPNAPIVVNGGFPMVIKYRSMPRQRIPWDNRRRKLEIVRI